MCGFYDIDKTRSSFWEAPYDTGCQTSMGIYENVKNIVGKNSGYHIPVV